MPLIKSKSKKAFEENVKTEMHSGKDQKQALAIAYATKRRAKPMYHGGLVEDDNTPEDELSEIETLSVEDDTDKEDMKFAEGGSVADRIMSKNAKPEEKPDEYEAGLLADQPDENEETIKEMWEESPEDEEQDKKGMKSLADKILAKRRK